MRVIIADATHTLERITFFHIISTHYNSAFDDGLKKIYSLVPKLRKPGEND